MPDVTTFLSDIKFTRTGRTDGQTESLKHTGSCLRPWCCCQGRDKNSPHLSKKMSQTELNPVFTLTVFCTNETHDHPPEFLHSKQVVSKKKKFFISTHLGKRNWYTKNSFVVKYYFKLKRKLHSEKLLNCKVTCSCYSNQRVQKQKY